MINTIQHPFSCLDFHDFHISIQVTASSRIAIVGPNGLGNPVSPGCNELLESTRNSSFYATSGRMVK